jgi:2-polyprenyl-3-methyl-5-hydroxy-6-metoxy-1,4-benzoquinol methylase
VLTGYKLVRTDLFKAVYLVSDRFGIEAELTAKLARLGARIYEVPVGYHGRTYDEGKKVTWRDGVAALWHIVRFNLLPGTYCRDAGHETLRNLGAVAGFNRYMYRTIAPFLGRRVLEVGAGIGNLTIHLARGREVVATELDAGYVETLRHRFRDRVSVDVERWDVCEPFSRTSAKFDSVVCLNVLEHIDDEGAALARVREVLRPDGALVLLVPAHPALFSSLDEAVGHRRRYARHDLETTLARAGYDIDRLFAFNFWGLFGWWLNGVVLRRRRLPGEQLSLFGRLSGPLTLVERLLGPPVGLSWIAIAHPVRS